MLGVEQSRRETSYRLRLTSFAGTQKEHLALSYLNDTLLNTLALELKIPAEPINAGDKMVAPW